MHESIVFLRLSYMHMFKDIFLPGTHLVRRHRAFGIGNIPRRRSCTLGDAANLHRQVRLGLDVEYELECCH